MVVGFKFIVSTWYRSQEINVETYGMGKTPAGLAGEKAKPLCRDAFIILSKRISQVKTPSDISKLSKL